VSTPEIDRLNGAITSLHNQLVFWTIIVAIGLVVEYAKPIKLFLVEALQWLFLKGKSPSLTASIIGGVLITIGVSMEGLVEFRALDADSGGL
jgi:hypothetical protein